MIIAFTGSLGVGKSTAIDELLKKDSVELIKFAGVLYDTQEFFYKQIESVYKRPKDFVKNRVFLQFLGSEIGRSIDVDLWVKVWKAKAEASQASIVVCDDCRFDNEAEAIKSMGGIIIQIKSNKNIERITTANGIANHASEAGIDQKFVDFTIENNGTLEDYKAKLQSLYAKIL